MPHPPTPFEPRVACSGGPAEQLPRTKNSCGARDQFPGPQSKPCPNGPSEHFRCANISWATTGKSSTTVHSGRGGWVRWRDWLPRLVSPPGVAYYFWNVLYGRLRRDTARLFCFRLSCWKIKEDKKETKREATMATYKEAERKTKQYEQKCDGKISYLIQKSGRGLSGGGLSGKGCLEDFGVVRRGCLGRVRFGNKGLVVDVPRSF